MEKSGSKLEAADSNGSAIVGTVATPAAATAFAQATTEPAVVVPSYKPLPDEDTNWKAKANSVAIDMGKLNGSADQAEAVDDGATEKMLKDDVKLTIVPSSKDDTGFSNNNHMKQRTPEDTALIYMAMLLPGTPILNVNDSLPYKESFAKLTKARQNVQFQHGKTSTYVLNNGTVFSYTRFMNIFLMLFIMNFMRIRKFDCKNIKCSWSAVRVATASGNSAANEHDQHTEIALSRVEAAQLPACPPLPLPSPNDRRHRAPQNSDRAAAYTEQQQQQQQNFANRRAAPPTRCCACNRESSRATRDVSTRNIIPQYREL
ncbi:unnamed protein product [Trichogramma brassicae]|uniref:Uncharacterized protein n=1 Tax=Trichogramma brassicae TaxID=86971 RepID=A0A6H5IJ63_9HYME|nr:unnamed protein product [Trichogramma brassicae]